MAGTFPGVCNTQQQDLDGRPLKGGKLSVYAGGVIGDFAETFQDINLLITAQNPLTADDSGRIPLFYVADGTYRLILTDETGDTSNGGFDLLQVPSIGPSSGGGGGGSTVDPNSTLTTGDVLCRPAGGIKSGWVRLNGLTIGSANSGASERANSDCEQLFLHCYQNFDDTICPVVDGRGANAAADWAANKKLTLIDAKGRAFFGVTDMGAPDSARIATAYVITGLPTKGGSSGGDDDVPLGQPNLPNVTLSAGSLTINITAGNFTLEKLNYVGNINLPGGGATRVVTSDGSTGTLSATFGGNVPLGGSGTPVNKMPPFFLGTWYMRL